MLALLAGCAQPPVAVPPASTPSSAAAPPAATASAFLPPEPPSGYTPKAIAFAQTDMVSAANPLAVQAGVDVLARGGSAVDAAIAVQMVLNVVEPQSSGIGGGAFMLHLDAASRRLLAYDGRETAPAAATPDQFLLPDGKPMPFRLRWTVACRWARRACCACWSGRTRPTAGCPGPTCLRPLSGWRRRALPSRPG